MAERGDYGILNEEEKLLERGEISLFLRDYEDIFSDFDPRSYSVRSLSVDFLDESKRATREVKPGFFELRLLVPKARKNAEKEETIKKRLKEHSRKHYEVLKKEKAGVSKQGFFFIFFGILFMFFAAYMLFNYRDATFWHEFLIVMLEPGGWFLFWEGLDLVIFEAKKKKPDIEFYKKMVRADIIFEHY